MGRTTHGDMDWILSRIKDGSTDLNDTERRRDPDETSIVAGRSASKIDRILNYIRHVTKQADLTALPSRIELAWQNVTSCWD